MRKIGISSAVIVCLLLGCFVGCSNVPGQEDIGTKPLSQEAVITQIKDYSEALTYSFDSSIGTYSLEPSSSQNNNNGAIISSDDGEENYSLLYFTDKKSNAKVVLCNAPNCQYNNEKCNAFVCSMMSTKEENGETRFPVLESDGYVFMHGEKLYVIDPFGDIVEMDKDGTNHKRLLSIDSKYNVISGFLYKENLYFYVWYLPEFDSNSEAEFSDKDHKLALLEINLNSGKFKELYSFNNELDTSCLGIFKDNVYYFYRSPNTVASATNQQAVDNEENNHDVSLYYYGLNGAERKYIKNSIKSYEMDDAVFDGGSIYYHNRKEKKLLRLNLESGENEVIVSDLGGYIEIYPPIKDGKLFFMKDNMLANAFSEEEQKNENYYVNLSTKEVVRVK